MKINKTENLDTKGIIKDGEYHPAANSAMRYIKSIPYLRIVTMQEAMASCAIEGNRMGEICSETLDRILTGKPVGDRYVLGLAWFLRDMEEKDGTDNSSKIIKVRK